MNTKRLSIKPLKTIGLALGLSLATAGILTPSAQAYENLIPDKELARCINRTISYDRDSDAIITKTDLAKLTKLSCWNWNGDITNVSGLEHAINLTSLDLSHNRIGNIAPIGKLSKLTSLSLGKIRLRDITPLAKLTNLTYLNLDESQIRDISALANLTNLTELSLQNNQISNISALSKLTNLTSLDLYSNQIRDIAPLANLPYLKSLDLDENQISNISALTDLTDLSYPELRYNQIRDFRPLSNARYTSSYDLYPQVVRIPVKLPDYRQGMKLVFSTSANTTEPLYTREGEKFTLEDNSYSITINDYSTYTKILQGEYAYNIKIHDKFLLVLYATNQPKPNTPNTPSTPSSSIPGVKATFSDTVSYPFVKEINWLAASGVTTGYSDGSFRPHDSVSRAAMAAFIYRLEGKPTYNAPAKSPFKDIKPGDDFYKEICWLASKGITTGYADGTFKPWDPIARDAMAAFLHRYDTKVAAKKLATKLAAKKFTDTAATPFSQDIAWLSSTGVTTGYADGSFRPYQSIERGAIAAFFYRMKH